MTASFRRMMPTLPREQDMELKTISRPMNGFLSALSADDFELVRPHLRTVELDQETVLIEAGETLKRAYPAAPRRDLARRQARAEANASRSP